MCYIKFWALWCIDVLVFLTDPFASLRLPGHTLGDRSHFAKWKQLSRWVENQKAKRWKLGKSVTQIHFLLFDFQVTFLVTTLTFLNTNRIEWILFPYIGSKLSKDEQQKFSQSTNTDHHVSLECHPMQSWDWFTCNKEEGGQHGDWW